MRQTNRRRAAGRRAPAGSRGRAPRSRPARRAGSASPARAPARAIVRIARPPPRRHRTILVPVACPAEETVLGYVDGQLAPELAARVDEHVDGCESCRRLVRLVAAGTPSLANTTPASGSAELALSPTAADLAPSAPY